MALPQLRVDVRTDFRAVLARFEVDAEKTVALAASRALNRAATSVRATAARLIREQYNIKSGTAKEQMKIVRASRDRLYADVIVSGRRIPLIQFSARQVRAGVTVRVKPMRKLVRHAFIARMPSGHVGVFARLGKTRLPIKELFSISLPKAFTQKQIIAALKSLAGERFRVEFRRELAFRTGATNG